MSQISRSPFGLRVDESPRDDAEARAFLLLAAALVGLVFVRAFVVEVLAVVAALVLVRPGGRLRARRCPSTGLRPAREDRSAALRPHCQGMERRAERRHR